MRLIERLQRDITSHPARASVLAVLTVLMLAMTVRAVLELRPQDGECRHQWHRGNSVRHNSGSVG